MYNCCYATIREVYKQYMARIREWEREYKYERDIVRSVPEKSENNSGTVIPDIDMVKPG